MRIDKLISGCGYGSRKDVKHILKKRQVIVNDQVVTSAKTQVNLESDVVTVRGEVILYKPFVYFMLNKPSGVVSATEDTKDQTVIDLLNEQDQRTKPFPVGRLDKDTEGLLLITNDGKLAHLLLSPKKKVGKRYYAKVLGEVCEADVLLFKKGVTLEDAYQTKEAVLDIISKGTYSEIELTITEGKFHQVKRMFEAVGKKVVYLKRLKMGELELDPALKLGQYRALKQDELDYLQSLKNK